MTYRNQTLHDTIKSYVIVALNLILRHVKHGDSVLDPAADLFCARLDLCDTLASLPEYKICLDALDGDPIISSQLNVMVGIHSRRSRTPTTESLARRLLDLGTGNDYSFDPERFDLEYEDFERAFYEPDFVYEVVAPLHGLLMSDSIKLADDLEVSPLRPEEMSDARKANPLRERQCAVRTTYRLPKVIGDDIEIILEDTEKERAIQTRVNDRIEQVVHAFRVFGADFVFPIDIAHRASKWLYGGDSVFPAKVLGDTLASNYLDQPTAESFRHFWVALQNEGVQKRRFLNVAVRRFGYACERHRTEDKIIDLLISAEALLMCDVNKNAYLGEIRYRFATRAAFFIGTVAANRKTIFRHMRDAYDERSKLAHGARPKRQGRELEEFVGMTQEYIRRALRRAITLATDPQTPYELVDWDELIFPVEGVSGS